MSRAVDRLLDTLDRGSAAVRDAREIRRLAQRFLTDPGIDQATVLGELVKWRLSWDQRNLDYRPPGIRMRKLTTARKAIRVIADGDTVISSGFATSGRCSVFFWAIREAFDASRHPAKLHWISVSGQGGRGHLPGTVEELGAAGLLSTYICGHLETARSLLILAEDGVLEMHTLPQGVMTRLLVMQGRGKYSVSSNVGVDTFLDPASGGGSAITPGARQRLVSRRGDKLVYSLPRINVALLSASFADRQGNLYYHNAPTISENSEVARAARRNGGKVLAVVSDIIDHDPTAVDLPGEFVDHIVVNPRHEQIGGLLQQNYWPMFSAGADVDVDSSLALVRFVNGASGVMARRNEMARAIARAAATLFVRETRPGAMVNIGVGMPEEVCLQLVQHGLHEQLTFTTEAGVYGGIPVPGAFFGSAINPRRIESSAWMFRQYQSRLDITVLGFLQVDSHGNVNVSKRGPTIADTIGPGGFCDIAAGAATVIFVGSWMVGGRLAIRGGELVIKRSGRCKFVDRVDQVTFNGQRALAAGKRVFYVTDTGVFQLTRRGLSLRQITPGVRLQQDLVEGCEANIHVDRRSLKIAPTTQLTGKGYDLAF